MEPLEGDLKFPDGPWPQDPPSRLPWPAYEALVLATISMAQSSKTARLREQGSEKYGNWEPFVLHED